MANYKDKLKFTYFFVMNVLLSNLTLRIKVLIPIPAYKGEKKIREEFG